MHAEAEFSMDGTVTFFAGPKGGIGGKIDGVGADFGVKDGIYAVIGKDGIQDAGFRVVIGGGIEAGSMGGAHDVGPDGFLLRLCDLTDYSTGRARCSARAGDRSPQRHFTRQGCSRLTSESSGELSSCRRPDPRRHLSASAVSRRVRLARDRGVRGPAPPVGPPHRTSLQRQPAPHRPVRHAVLLGALAGDRADRRAGVAPVSDPARSLARAADREALALLLIALGHGLAAACFFHYFGSMGAEMASYAPWQHAGHILFGDNLLLFDTIRTPYWQRA